MHTTLTYLYRDGSTRTEAMPTGDAYAVALNHLRTPIPNVVEVRLTNAPASKVEA